MFSVPSLNSIAHRIYGNAIHITGDVSIVYITGDVCKRLYTTGARSPHTPPEGNPDNSWNMSAWAMAIMAAIVEPKRSSLPGVMGPSKILCNVYIGDVYTHKYIVTLTDSQEGKPTEIRLVGMQNPMRDKDEGTYRGEGTTTVTTACPEDHRG